MGLFSSKKKVSVSSVAYNLAGVEADRVDFLKTTLVGSAMRGGDSYMGENLTRAYINGPGVKISRFATWAETSGYNSLLGLSTGKVGSSNGIDLAALSSVIKGNAVHNIEISTAEMGMPDYTFWAEDYMLKNYPDQLDTDWYADFNEDLNEIRIQLLNGPVVSFTPVSFDRTRRYLYAGYYEATGAFSEPIVFGEWVLLPPGSELPSMAGWSNVSSVNTPVTLVGSYTTEKLITYSDGRPDEQTLSEIPIDIEYIESNSVFEKVVYMGQSATNPGRTYSIKSTMYREQTGVLTSSSESFTNSVIITGGITKTTVTTITTQAISLLHKYKTDTQELVENQRTNIKLLIYAEGTGNAALDAMFTAATSIGRFLPFIPIRLDNKFLSTSNLPNVYAKSKRALKKATSGKYTNVVDKIADNESIGDIDYAYIVFGVSLNVVEPACQKYLFIFFKNLLLTNPGSHLRYESWKFYMAQAKASYEAHKAWETQANNDGERTKLPEPPVIPYPVLPKYSLVLASAASWTNYNITLTWSGIRETVGSGQGRPGAKKGDVWRTIDPDESFWQLHTVYGGWESGPRTRSTAVTNNSISFWFQDSVTTWRRIRIINLVHTNLIYGGKSVVTKTSDAFGSDAESGFIIPLHDQTFRDMGIVDYTQMSTACAFIVFNTYTVTKKKWYQSGLFSIIVIVIIIVIAIYYPPAAGALSTGGGILGANVAVGSALGAAAGSAAIVGAIANAVAAMIVMNVVTSASKAIFGNKLGAIIGTIAGIIAVQYVGVSLSGQSMASSFGNMMKAENLMKLSMSVGNSVGDYMKASAQEVLGETVELLASYEQEASKIAKMYADQFGDNGVYLDPLRLTDAVSKSVESSDSFLSRTLMTGSDIADLSLGMIGNFASLTLNTQQSI